MTERRKKKRPKNTKIPPPETHPISTNSMTPSRPDGAFASSQEFAVLFARSLIFKELALPAARP